MTARRVAQIVSLAAGVSAAACTSFYEIPIETPIQPKLDVSAFQRVLIAGFIAGGTEDVDANLETVRLLRSQLRTKSNLRVIEADVLPLASLAAGQLRSEAQDGRAAELSAKAGSASAQEAQPEEPRIRTEKDLEAYERIFADVDFWKKIGEEYQQPLIVTGTILFTPHARAGIVQREREYYDAFGRRMVEPVRTYMERKGYRLVPKFIFIDGRTGATLYSETFSEEILYSPQQNTPALSSYFELMDRLMPSFLNTLSAQKIRGTRVLLK
ncbi:MAG TPA: hypothetical protein VNI83_15125 [Vicinamibacterales bacterium]|nr:hypothetical protein [Vicinamibacterales bacterium]